MNAWNLAVLTGVITIGGKIAGNKQLDHSSYIKLIGGAFFYLLILSLLDSANDQLAGAFAMVVFITALLNNAIPITKGLGLSS